MVYIICKSHAGLPIGNRRHKGVFPLVALLPEHYREDIDLIIEVGATAICLTTIAAVSMSKMDDPHLQIPGKEDMLSLNARPSKIKKPRK